MTSKTRPTPPRVAPAELHLATPGLGWYTDNVLFGEIWENPALSKRDRSLVTVSTLVTRGYMAQLTGHFNRALNHGVSPTELAELITHLAFYAGWPVTMSAVGVMRQVFESRGLALDLVTQSTSEDQPLGQATVAERAGPSGVTVDELARQVIHEDLWRRQELGLRDRSLVTIASLIAQGELGTLAQQVQAGLNHGLTREDLRAALAHQAFYAGWPRVQAAQVVVESVF